MASTVNQRLADLMIRRHLVVQRLTNHEVAKILDLWSKLRPNLAGQLYAALDQNKSRLITDKALRALLRGVQGTVNTALRQHFAVLADDLEEFAADEATFYPRAVQQSLAPALTAAPAVSVVAAVTGAQVAAAAASLPFQGNTMLTWPEAMGEWMRTLITNTARAGYLQGKPTRDIVNDVMRSVGGKGAQGISSVVKSAVNHYSATARELTAKANKDLIEARRWLSTLDTHTSPMCQLRDRLFYPLEVTDESLGSVKVGGKGVPGSMYGSGPGKLHYCCRSTETWKIKGVEDWPDSKRPALKVDAGRWLTETVPSSTSFFDWVQRQPRSVLEELYGVQRADQILKGMKVPTMFNDRGEMMSIAELKAKGLWDD